jgi:hypothetical protein
MSFSLDSGVVVDDGAAVSPLVGGGGGVVLPPPPLLSTPSSGLCGGGELPFFSIFSANNRLLAALNSACLFVSFSNSLSNFDLAFSTLAVIDSAASNFSAAILKSSAL